MELVCIAKTRPVVTDEPWEPSMDDYVFLTRKAYEYYSEDDYNPFGIIGKIDWVRNGDYSAQWSNGNHNSYGYADCFRKATKAEIIAVYGEAAINQMECVK